LILQGKWISIDRSLAMQREPTLPAKHDLLSATIAHTGSCIPSAVLDLMDGSRVCSVRSVEGRGRGWCSSVAHHSHESSSWPTTLPQCLPEHPSHLIERMRKLVMLRLPVVPVPISSPELRMVVLLIGIVIVRLG
jgi:hypothetical protein